MPETPTFDRYAEIPYDEMLFDIWTLVAAGY